MMFRLFESALDPTEKPAETQPPATLVAFYWHFARQAKGPFGALFVTGLMVALLDAAIPAFMGKIVTLVTSAKPETLCNEHWHLLLGIAVVLVLWFVGDLLMRRMRGPRMRDRSKDVSEARSWLIGRIVDTYTNILTVKLFARARDEDAYVREAFDEHTGLFYASLRLNTVFSL